MVAEPEIPEHLSLAWEAFWELSDDRPYTVALGFGASVQMFGAIPFPSVDAYARRFGVDHPDDFARFASLIREMDAEWRMIANERKS